jgi:membrane glycosyltransferase
MPVVGALALSIPLSVYSSRVGLGRSLRRARLFLIPEESDPPRELRTTQAHVTPTGAAPRFVDAVVDPVTNAIACAASVLPTRRPVGVRRRRDLAIADALATGPDALTDRQKLFFLTDGVALSHLHFKVWTSPSAHPGWRVDVATPDAGTLTAAS